MSTVREFKVEWSEADVGRLLARVASTRLPVAPAASGWTYGCDADFLQRFQRYWTQEYDWRGALGQLNRYPQYIATIDGHDIHYLHVRGEGNAPRPLLVTHGWPGSQVEFWDVIEPLAFPTRHGGRAEDAFDLILPSLPGYGFSGRPSMPIGQRATARLWNILMTEVLGYPRYLAQGGDLGAIVASWLAFDHGSVDAIHLNLLAFRHAEAPRDEAEGRWTQASLAAQQTLGAYSALHRTRPQSLAWAAADNPLGQAAWILERFHDWADLRTRDFEAIFAFDRLVTNVMLYVMTESFSSALWQYPAMVGEGMLVLPVGTRCETATAYTHYADPLLPAPPRGRAERVYRIERWVEAPSGGHFAAMENPAFFSDDVRDWARSLGAQGATYTSHGWPARGTPDRR
jgi:pimeloyl-ACP methyl ester carboxylesterase